MVGDVCDVLCGNVRDESVFAGGIHFVFFLDAVEVLPCGEVLYSTIKFFALV